jgi:hypothetical protein
MTPSDSRSARPTSGCTGWLSRSKVATRTSVADSVHPERHPHSSRQAAFWVDCGRALARLRRRRDDAVRALRRAEVISPHHVHRNPMVREVLAELMSRARNDAVGRELRGMAYRAGLLI